MLIEAVHMYNLKTLVQFFMERSHHTIPNVKMADVLASYIL